MKTFIIAALTADGFIGRTSEHGADWTGGEDKKVFVALTKAAGTIVMGANTFATIGRALPGRRNIVYTHHPDLITAEGVETTAEEPAALLARLRSEGAGDIAICGGSSIYTLFWEAGCIDELYLTITPQLFGAGLPLFNDAIDTAQLELLESRQLSDGAVLLQYRVVH